MNEDNISKYLIDSDTGEVLDTFNYGDKITKVSKKQLDYLNETVVINENKNWNKLINYSLILLSTNHLTAIECQILFVLMDHIG